MQSYAPPFYYEDLREAIRARVALSIREVDPKALTVRECKALLNNILHKLNGVAAQDLTQIMEAHKGNDVENLSSILATSGCLGQMGPSSRLSTEELKQNITADTRAKTERVAALLKDHEHEPERVNMALQIALRKFCQTVVAILEKAERDHHARAELYRKLHQWQVATQYLREAKR